MKRLKLAIALSLAAVAAQASVITFDSHTPLYDFSSATIVDSGYQFGIANFPTDAIGVSDLNPLDPVQGAFNGTAYLHFSEFGNGETMTMRRQDGAAFLLDSFDLGLSWYVQDVDVNSTLVTISGDLAGGGSFSSSTTLGRSFATQTVGSAITELRISVDLVSGGYLSLDNFNVRDTTLPEPASLALVGLALAGMGFARRSRRA
jgi:hypothetical protein